MANEVKRRTRIELASSAWKAEALPLSYRRANEATPLSGAASMTVCTNHLALCNLVEHVPPIAVSKPGRDPELLVPEMVELKDDRVGLAAVSTRVVAKVGHQEDESLF
jgi:hypothetical protein